MALRYQHTLGLASLLASCALALSTLRAHAVTDEIQVYNADIAKVGQWTLQSHSNYAISGRKDPDFEGGIIPHHALNGTPELAYGITEWWEMGFYAPYAVDQNREFSSNGGKIRQLFVTPNAAKREFFYGVNFEVSYATPRFLETKWNLEVRPIIGVRKNDYEFIVNPIVDVGFGVNGDVTFLPCARFARNFGENFALGLEYLHGPRTATEFLAAQSAAAQPLWGGGFQDRSFRCECRDRLWSHCRFGPMDGQDDHWHRAQ
jgi:hypothetical protein